MGRYSASGFCFAQLRLEQERNQDRKQWQPSHEFLFIGKSETCFRRNSGLYGGMLVTGRLTVFDASFGPGRLRGFIRGHIDGKNKPLAVAADRAEAALDRARQSEEHLWRADPERRGGLHISGHHHEVV